MDPGNWATDLEGGARFGYRLLWVLIASNALAIFLQALSARLGVVAGRDLAQACRDAYPAAVSNALWVICEFAIAACDLAEVLGAAIGLNLLLHIPLLAGILLTAADTLVLLWLQQYRIRSLEMVIVRLIVIVIGCLGMEASLAKPETSGLLIGLLPTLDRDSLYATITILGATVMPHNLYLHSALVQTRRIGDSTEAKAKACRYNLIDTMIALNAAMVVNIIILVLAASVFFTKHIEVVEIQQAMQLLEPLLGTKAAGVVFAVALICAGQASTITGTISGQIVMEGFLNLRMRAWLRRLITRSVAILPAIATVYFAGDKGAYKLLLLTQAVLSMQLPFALIPLIRFTGNRRWMGQFANKVWVKAVAWMAALLILGLNLWLAHLNLVEWLTFEGISGTTIGVAVLLLLGGLLLLLVYISVTPISLHGPAQGPDLEPKRPGEVLFMDQVTAEAQAVEQLDAVMTHLHGVAFIKDAMGRYIYFGAAACALMGLEPENVLGQTDDDLWPADVARSCRKNDESVLKSMGRFEGIEEYPRGDKLHSWLVMKFPIIERGSQTIFLGGVAIDVTDQRRSEEQFQRLAARLQADREGERATTSRAIEDFGQRLTALEFHLATIGQHCAQSASSEALQHSVGAASEILASTISTSAKLALELRPSILDNLGLPFAIRWHAREVASRSGLELNVDQVADVQPAHDVAILVFRLFQGVLKAIEDKKNAIQLHVFLSVADAALVLEVTARGRRSIREGPFEGRVLDLIEAKELSLLFGGIVRVYDSSEGDTTVAIEAPCQIPVSLVRQRNA